MTLDLLLSARYIVAHSGVLENASLGIKDGVIVALGDSKHIHEEYRALQERDLGQAMLMPGLVNAHTHVAMVLLRSFADDLPLLDWLHQHIFPAEAKLTDRMIELATRFACMEMIRTGTTAFVDMYLHEAAVLRGVQQGGMRALCGEVIFEFPTPAYQSWGEAKQLIREQQAFCQASPLLQTAVMPHSVYTTNTQLLKDCRHFADELGLPLHLHLAESQEEVEMSLARHGLSPVAYAQECGLLTSRTSLAHTVKLSEREMDMIATHDCMIAHNPVSNLKLGSGIAPLTSLLERGVRVGIGTDGAASNNSLNMFESMKLAALLAKGTAHDPTQVPATMALQMATEGSASIFNIPMLGTLQMGAPADCIALDLHAANLHPCYHPISTAVYSATGHECILNVVNGKILFDQGKFRDEHYDDLLAEIDDIAQFLKR